MRPMNDTARRLERKAAGLAPFVDCGRDECCGGRCEDAAKSAARS